MNSLILSFTLGIFVFSAQSSAEKLLNPGDQFVVSSFNVENLFDTLDDAKKNDHEFTPKGRAKWTKTKLGYKVDQLAKVIRSMNNGRGPDVLALPETENINALKILNAELKGLDYTPVLIEGPDIRGIDVALLTRFKVVDKMAIRVDKPGDSDWTRPTRPVYKIKLQVSANSTMTVLLNHWPSRAAPEKFRCKAGKVVRDILVEELSLRQGGNFVVMGDLNDEPENYSIRQCLGSGTKTEARTSNNHSPILFNAYLEKNLSEKQRATYYYGREKKWNALDHILMNKNLLKGPDIRYVANSFKRVANETNTMDVQFKTPKGRKVPAGAPIPFSVISKSGRHMEVVGASDHLPVVATFEVLK